MDTTWPLFKLLRDLSTWNYDHTFSAYRFWVELGAAHRIVSNHQLDNDLLNLTNTNPGWIEAPWSDGQNTPRGHLIYRNADLLLRFITDAELDPTLSTYAIGLHDRLCRESLKRFFGQVLDYTPGGWRKSWEEPTPKQLCEFYTRANLIAHWVNLGYVKLEDVRDHILQSLALQPIVYSHQLNSLMILLKISGATFAAYVDPSVMDRCCDLLKPTNLGKQLVLIELAEVSAPILTVKIS